MDAIDKKILFFLDQNSRITNKQLAKKIRLSTQGLGYRLKILENQNVIKGYITIINPFSLGYQHYKIFMKLHYISDLIEKQIIDYLVENKYVRWVASTSGKYDMSFSILASSPTHFSEIYAAFEAKFSKYISEKNIAIALFSPGFSRGWLVGEKSSTKFDYQNRGVKNVDEVDKKILKRISQNARQSLVKLAEKTKLTVDVVKYRLRKLRENNVITGFTINLHLKKLGYEYYTLFLNLYDLDQKLENSIIEFSKSHSNVLFVLRVIGNYDMQIEIEVKDYEELEKNLKSFRKYFANNIRNFEILRVTEQFKYDFYPFAV